MNHLNRIAASLEDAGVVDATLIPDDPNTSNPMVDDSEELHGGVELLANLESIYQISQRMLAAGKISQESAQLLQFTMSEVLGMNNDELYSNNLSLECYANPEVYHARMNVAMEGMLSNIPGRLAERFKTFMAEHKALFSKHTKSYEVIIKRLQEIRDKLNANFDETKFDEIRLRDDMTSSMRFRGEFPKDLGTAVSESIKSHKKGLRAVEVCFESIDKIIDKLATSKSEDEIEKFISSMEHPLLSVGISDEGDDCLGDVAIKVKKSDKKVVSDFGDIAYTHKLVYKVEVIKPVGKAIRDTIPFLGRENVEAKSVKSSLDQIIALNKEILTSIKSTKLNKSDFSDKIAEANKKAKENGISASFCNKVSSLVSNLLTCADKSMGRVSGLCGFISVQQMHWWTSLANKISTLDIPKVEVETPFSYSPEE